MAQIEDPKKVFQFGYLAAGLNPYAVQEVDIPDFELEIAEHGDTNFLVKTAGIMKFGDITMHKLRPVSESDDWVWGWIQSITDVIGGGMSSPLDYKKNHDIVQYSYDNITVTDRWACKGLFPKKINGQKLNRAKSDNSIDEIVFSVDRVIKT